VKIDLEKHSDIASVKEHRVNNDMTTGGNYTISPHQRKYKKNCKISLPQFMKIPYNLWSCYIKHYSRKA
jgi:hypothetical protein